MGVVSLKSTGEHREDILIEQQILTTQVILASGECVKQLRSLVLLIAGMLLLMLVKSLGLGNFS